MGSNEIGIPLKDSLFDDFLMVRGPGTQIIRPKIASWRPLFKN